MSSLALSFNDVNFHPVAQNDGQIWLTSRDLGKALGYSREDAVNKIYERNAEEFSSNMTCNVKMTLKGQSRDIRIFSLRGCHLIAMFAKTAVAKLFRVWVLDILDKEVKTTANDRTPLRQACDRLAVGNMLVSDAYKIVTERYKVEHIDQIPMDKLPEAVAFVYEMILRLKPTQSSEPISPRETNEVKQFWKFVGQHQYEETSKLLRNLKATLRLAENQLNQINDTRSLVSDALTEPKHSVGGQADEIYQQALAFISRQNAMKV